VEKECELKIELRELRKIKPDANNLRFGTVTR